MNTALAIFSIIIVISLFFRFNRGVGIYLLYFFLVPLYFLYFGAFSVGTNLFELLILGIMVVWTSSRGGGITKYNVSLFYPFLFLFFAQAVFIPFHFSEMPVIDQLNYFRVDVMSIFLPFVIVGVALKDKNSGSFFTAILYIAIVVSSIYTFYLLSSLGQNPYIDSLSELLYSYDEKNMDDVAEEGDRVFGYISSVYTHVTEYGVFLVFSSVFLLRQMTQNDSILPKVLYILVLICMFVCGSRSVIMAEGVVILVFLFQQRQLRLFFGVLFLGLLLLVAVLEYMPSYFQFISSIGDETLNGSSIQMRIRQLNGCFESIQGNPVFGNGYSWTGWYRNTVGIHPQMLSFESCLIQILCNNGLMGIFIWVVFVVMLIRSVRTHFAGNVEFMQTISLMLFAYFSYTFFTGDYGTFYVMMVFYALIIANEYNTKQIKSVQ